MIADDELEGLLSLFEVDDLAPERAAEVEARLEQDPGARALLRSFELLGELCEEERDEGPVLPEAVAARVLAEVHAALEVGEDRAAGELPEVLTPEEVARVLRVPREELERELPGMPFFEFAGRLRMRRDRLFEWIEEREQASRRQRLFAVPGGSPG